MNRFFLVPALGVAALALSTPAHAQPLGRLSDAVAPSYADDARQPYYESRRVAYDNGYREGLREGAAGRPQAQRLPLPGQSHLAAGRQGLQPAFGDLERYRQQFRAGFSEGYQAGYGRYGQGNARYGNGRAVPRQATRADTAHPIRTATDTPTRPTGTGAVQRRPNGYLTPPTRTASTTGIEKGREDARKRRSFDPAAPRVVPRRRAALQERIRLEAAVRRTSTAQGFKEGYDRGYRELGYIR